jgi:hypothetical protein
MRNNPRPPPFGGLHGLDDEGKAVSQVVARPAVELHPLAGLASDDPEPIVLDLVQPVSPGGRFRGRNGEARPHETARKNSTLRTRQHGGKQDRSLVALPQMPWRLHDIVRRSSAPDITVVLTVSPGSDVCLRVGALIVRRSVRALETTRRKWPQRQFANQKALVANAKRNGLV